MECTQYSCPATTATPRNKTIAQYQWISISTIEQEDQELTMLGLATIKKELQEPGMVMHTCNPTTSDAETGGS